MPDLADSGKLVIGADPGTTGCVVVLFDGKYLDHMHMPTMKVGSGNRVNAAALARWLRQYEGASAYLEAVHSMPKQGVASVFTFGHSAGVIEGLLSGLGFPLTLVTPQAWKKQAKLIGLEKDAARVRAIQLFPGIADLDLKAKGQALADALLIANFGPQC